MSNLYSKIATKPIKRNQEQLNMSFSQTHSWMNGKKIFSSHVYKIFILIKFLKLVFVLFTVETFNNGSLLLSPPHNNPLMQRDNMQVTQPCSAPSSPLASPGALSSTSFTIPSNGTSTATDTADPNWQASKPTIRERNAAMFNNELMADIKFIVGSDGKFVGGFFVWVFGLKTFFIFSDHIQIIPAHKYVLATGSSVFYAMFYGGLADNKQEIKVPDVEPSAFLTLLK